MHMIRVWFLIRSSAKYSYFPYLLWLLWY